MKKLVTLISAVLALLLLSACGTNDDAVTPTDVAGEDDNSIELTTFVLSDAVFKNTKTGESFTYMGLVNDALATFSDISYREQKNSTTYYDGKSTSDYKIEIVDRHDETKGNAVGFIDTVTVNSLDWVFNDVLKVGMSAEKLAEHWGEASASEYGRPVYIFDDPIIGKYKATIYIGVHNTIEKFSLQPEDPYAIISIPYYIAKDHMSIYSFHTIPGEVLKKEEEQATNPDCVDFSVSFKNTSGKTIKYLTIEATPYDIDGIEITLDNGGGVKSIEFSEAVEFTEDIHTLTAEDVWESALVESAKINSLQIVYDDDAFESYNFKVTE